MKTLLLFTFALMVFLSCSDNKNRLMQILELEDVAKLSLSKSVRSAIDTLNLDINNLTFIEEPPGIVCGINVDYNNKGTIEFIFPRTSIISDNLESKEEYLNKIADKIINEVHWKNDKGKTGSLKGVTIY